MLVAHGDWMPLGSADEGKEAKAGTVEAWGRDGDNPVGGYYGLKKGLRGRFANYVPPVLEALGLAGQKVLMVAAEPRPQFEASARNIPGVSVIRAEGLNVYDVLRHGSLVIAKDALAALVSRFEAASGEES